MNIFLLQSVLAQAIVEKLEACEGVSSVNVNTTPLPRNAEFFDSLQDVDDVEDYIKFITGALRLVVNFSNGDSKRLYFYFRNKRAEDGSFTEPSSFEFGDVQDKKFISWHKCHYNEFDEFDGEEGLNNAIIEDCVINLKRNLFPVEE